MYPVVLQLVHMRLGITVSGSPEVRGRSIEILWTFDGLSCHKQTGFWQAFELSRSSVMPCPEADMRRRTHRKMRFRRFP